jgi:cyclic pyranopterin phosphate synthase
MKRFKMVDISNKDEVFREATVIGRIKLRPETIKLISDGKVEKGDPLAVAEIAAIMSAKNTPQIIPFCHPIPVSNVQTEAKIHENYIEAEISVRSSAKTGVEMEALVAVSTYLLTIWDMVKKVEKDADGQFPETSIETIRVKEKKKAKT